MKLLIECYSFDLYKNIWMIVDTNNEVIELKLAIMQSVDIFSKSDNIETINQYILNYANKQYVIDEITYRYLEKIT